MIWLPKINQNHKQTKFCEMAIKFANIPIRVLSMKGVKNGII